MPTCANIFALMCSGTVRVRPLNAESCVLCAFNLTREGKCISRTNDQAITGKRKHIAKESFIQDKNSERMYVRTVDEFFEDDLNCFYPKFSLRTAAVFAPALLCSLLCCRSCVPTFIWMHVYRTNKPSSYCTTT